MRIKLISVISQGENPIIHFVCDIGEARGRWLGSKRHHPTEGGIYDVEFDWGCALVVGENVIVQGDRPPGFEILGDSLQVTGVYESEDNDGVGYLRLASESLSMLELIGSRVQPGNAITLLLNQSEFLITPFGSKV